MWKRTKKNVIKFIFSYLMIKTEYEKFNKKKYIENMYNNIDTSGKGTYSLSIYWKNLKDKWKVKRIAVDNGYIVKEKKMKKNNLNNYGS